MYFIQQKAYSQLIQSTDQALKINKPILYKIIEGIFALEISKDTVPDFYTNIDFCKI